jgi:hypothetical protein
MTSWARRLFMWALITVVMIVHANATASLSNTPIGMLAFHGSAALLDWLLLLVAPAVLSGRLCDHTQWLCLLSIVGNAAGWLLYMAYAPPSFYNVFMWGLTVAQWLRLITPDRHADYLGLDLVPDRHRIRGGHHS